MIRIFLILIAAAVSYFGIVFLIETKSPSVQSKAETPSTEIKKANPHGLPDGVIGSFLLNQSASEVWLSNEATLSDDDRSRFRETHTLQHLFNFDGDYLWRDSEDTKISISTKEVTEEYVKLLATVSLSGTEQPTEFFLQWDDKGFWLTQPLTVAGGNKKLYRARYERAAE